MAVLAVLTLVAVVAEQVKPVLLEVLDLVATEVMDPLMSIKQDLVKHMLAVAAVVVIPDLADLVELAVAVMEQQQVMMAVMDPGTLAVAVVVVLLQALVEFRVEQVDQESLLSDIKLVVLNKELQKQLVV